MPETLLETKLYIPPLRPNLVPRPHLVTRLNQGHQPGHKLTLVSAPAGFGKTTLISAWIAANERPAAWLSLDEGDNESTRFLAYLIVTLQTIAENIGEGVLSMLQSSQPPPIETILTALLNEIAAVPENFALVLDDYHVIDTSNSADPSEESDALSSIDGILTFLLEHLPSRMHVVIATREDPNLPLARLRGRGQLIELRVTDLRFTQTEAAEFLNQVMGLNLSAVEVSTLETRTEGWIAGLQLAALAIEGPLSMRGRKDVSGFIHAFAGNNRYIVDYLVEEVLHRQPERVRSFLLQTSILDRLSGPICDAVRFGVAETLDSSERTAVTGQEDGKAMLEALERGNLFVVHLDDRRQWYRYHHLFGDVLHAHLLEEYPNLVPTLHRRASKWYEHNGSKADAIRHAFSAEDFERAAGLIELAWPEMDWSFQSTTWLGWVMALPDALVRLRPVLSASYAWALLNDGELEAAETRLQDAEGWLDTQADVGERPHTQSNEMVVVDKEQFHSLPATIASARAYLAQTLGDVPGSVIHARRALDLIPDGDYQGRGRVAVLLGLTYWASGDLEAAHQTFTEAMEIFRSAGNILYAISFTFILADIRIAQGRLNDALIIYERSMELASDQGEPILQGTAFLYLGLSELYREKGDLDISRQYLLKSEELGDQTEVYRNRLCRAMARNKVVQGELDSALDLLDEADRWLFYRNPIPDVRPIAALKTRVWIAQGKLATAFDWATEQGLSVDDDLSYMREYEHLTLARLLVTRYEKDGIERSIIEAIGLLERLLNAAEEEERIGSVIEILILQALAHQAQENIPASLATLERALTLTMNEGYFRIFVDEGPPMATLLREASKRGITPKYVNQLLAAFGQTHGTSPAIELLIEPLSKREVEVLRLLGTEMNGPEISRELMVSPNTMRTHTKNIYSKLGVHNRRAAVRRAEELGLL